MDTQERIRQYVTQDPVVLFMKGTPQQPQCGFSAKTASILSSMVSDYKTYNVLADEELREGIKTYGNWPTIPQLYVNGELVGGCDIVTQMFNAGELHQTMGLEQPDRTPPSITITDAAAENIRAAMTGHDGLALHFNVDGSWQSQFNLAPEQGHEVAAESNGIRLLMDLASAQRARGAVIDWVDSLQGEGLTIQLPQAPPPVNQLSVQELKAKLDANEELLLLDVRNAEERGKAAIDQAQSLDREMMERLETLPKDTPLAFICHHGNASLGAAEHYRRQGFTDISNVSGGINAWSLEVDASVPQY